MKNIFLKQNYYKKKWYLIDASKKSLGRLCCEIIKFLIGKNTSYFLKTKDQGNFVIILNLNKSNILKKNYNKKFYYKKSKTPGHLKKISFNTLKMNFLNKILYNMIIKMLSPNKLKCKYIKRLFIFNHNLIIYNQK